MLVVFPAPFTPTIKITRGPEPFVEFAGFFADAAAVGLDGVAVVHRQDANDVRLDLALELAGVGERVAIQFFAHGIQNFARRFHAKVGGEQRRFQFFQQRRINLALAEKNVFDGLRQRRLRLTDRGFQPFEQRRLDFFRFSKERNHEVERFAGSAT